MDGRINDKKDCQSSPHRKAPEDMGCVFPSLHLRSTIYHPIFLMYRKPDHHAILNPWTIKAQMCCVGGGCTHNLACHSHIWPLTSHPYKAGTEHAGFSPDQGHFILLGMLGWKREAKGYPVYTTTWERLASRETEWPQRSSDESVGDIFMAKWWRDENEKTTLKPLERSRF